MTRAKTVGPKTMDCFWLIWILICNLCIFWTNNNNLKTAHSKMGSLEKHRHIHVFVWVVKKRLTTTRVLLTQQILLFEHCIENNLRLIFVWCIARFGTICIILKTWKTPIPVDTGRKLNVHKTFRRHPGRLLNVLCTFNYVLSLWR